MDTTLELNITREQTQYTVKAKSNLGEREGFFHVDPSLNSKIYDIQEAVKEQTSLDEEFVENLGIQLFEMLFSTTKGLFHQCLDNSDHVDIILNTNDPALHLLPWELCYDPDYQLFLGADSRCSFVRRDKKSGQSFKKIEYPLKVLVIISSPVDLDEKGEYQPDPDEITKMMEPLRTLQQKGMVVVDFLERASVQSIQDHLKEQYHIVHFIGHGAYGEGKGYLVIEDKERNSKTVEGKAVARLFGTKTPQLLILTACESSPLIPFLLQKVPAVLAMQYTVLVCVAHQFVERFYSSLVKGATVGQAVSDARVAVSLEEGIGNPGWFTPVLYARSDSVVKVDTESPVVVPEKKVVPRADIVTDLTGVEMFVGRRKDLWLVEKALLEDNLKVVVVTGIGGIGKTALASKFVNKHKDRFHAVFARKIVDLGMSVEEILGFLDMGLVQTGDKRLHEVIGEIDLGRKLEVLHQCLEGGYLIVLDNFELLIENNRIKNEDVERVLKSMLVGDHGSKVVITSRYGFTFRDDKGGGLVGCVDLKDLSQQAAVQLLERLGIKDYEMRRKIHEKIGGNPQFLEFFVQLAKTRSTERLLEDVTPVRERVGEWLLRGLVGVLTEEEGEVLKRISVFRLKIDEDGVDVLGISDDVVDTLVYYSLVKVDEGFFMHQAVRDYVYGLLSDDEKVKAHAEAAAYYKILVETERAEVEDILELHYHLVESGQYEEAGALVIGLVEPFWRRGYWGVLWELLVQTVKTTDGKTKAAGLHSLGIVLQSFGEYAEAEKLYRESLDIAKRLGDTAGIASSLHQLGRIHEVRGEYAEAEKLYRESLDILKRLGDTAGIARSLHQLGMIHKVRGEYAEAEKLYRESLDIAKRLGDTAGIASSLHQLGTIHEVRGEYAEAEKLYRESLDIKKRLGDTAGIARSLGQLGRIHEEKGDYKEAVEHYIMALSILSKLGSPDAEIAVKSLKRVRKIIGDAEFDSYWKALTNQEVPDYIYPTYEEQIEDLVQYVLYIVDMNEHDQIQQTTETLTALLKESEPEEKQLLQLLIDYITRKDISQHIKKLKEPYKSILEKYL